MTFELPMRFEDARLLWTVPDVYTPDECRQTVEEIERWGPTLATNNPMYRDQDRVMRDDAERASELLRRLRPHLPERMGPLRLVGLNERLRFYRYQPGQQFPPHTDHWYWPSTTQVTLLTVLVYFNDDFEGGETRFTEHLEDVVVPKPGLVAIFQHKLRHEGCAVRRGVKYAMRTDVIYEGDVPVVRPGASGS
jgi:prolyl 4-hydroxylase